MNDVTKIGDEVVYRSDNDRNRRSLYRGNRYKILNIRRTDFRLRRNEIGNEYCYHEFFVENENGNNQWYPASEFEKKKIESKVVEQKSQQQEKMPDWLTKLLELYKTRALAEDGLNDNDEYLDALENLTEEMGWGFDVKEVNAIEFTNVRKKNS